MTHIMPAQPLPIAQHTPEDLVFLSDTKELVTDSLLVADHFGKQHRDVLRKIRTLDCSSVFRSAHFYAHPYINKQNGETYECYQMTKDGFMFLVMGFTGKKAAVIKEAYITAFNEMEKQLHQQPQIDPFDFLFIVRDLHQSCRKLREGYLDYLDFFDDESKKQMGRKVSECSETVDEILKVAPRVTRIKH